MAERKLRRPIDKRMIGGVCAGLAYFFDLDVSLLRIAYAVLTFFTGFAGIPIYLLMWIIIPQEKRSLYD